MIALALIGKMQQSRDTLYDTPGIKLYYIETGKQCENYDSLENDAITILSLLLLNKK